MKKFLSRCWPFILFFIFTFLYNSVTLFSVDFSSIKNGRNVWFQSDARRYYKGMTDRLSDHERSSVHPLFPAVTYLPVTAATHLGLSKKSSVIILYSLLAGVWATLLSLILWILCGNFLDTLIFTALGIFSSSFLFLSILPETYLLGSISLLTCFLVYLKGRSISAFILVTLMSFSITITNGGAAIISLFSRLEFKKAIKVILTSMTGLLVLVIIQKLFFPSGQYFFDLAEESQWFFDPEAGGIVDKSRVFFLYSLVSPVIDVLPNKFSPEWPLLTIQLVKLKSSFSLLNFLIGVWIFLLGRGLVYGVKNFTSNRFVILFLAYQFCLHFIYGDETFLYSLHWLPFLIILAALNCKMKYWGFLKYSVVVFTCLVIYNNLKIFNSVWEIVENYN